MAVESTKLAQQQILSQAAQQAINMATAKATNCIAVVRNMSYFKTLADSAACFLLVPDVPNGFCL
jgi:Mrp family chromosome partitioning ATPase